MLRKEISDLLREPRLLAVLLVVTLLLSAPLAILGERFVLDGDYAGAPSFDDVLQPVVFLGPVVVLVTSLVFSADLMVRERDQGTWAILASSPVTPTGIYLGKLGGSLAAYLALAGTVLAFHLVLVPALGWPFLEALAWLLFLPLLALYILLTGVGLLASAALDSSKGAIGAVLAVDLTLLFLQRDPPGLGFFIRERAPGLWDLLAYTPFDMALTTGQAIVYGQAFPWTPMVVTLLLAALLLVAGWFTLVNREGSP